MIPEFARMHDAAYKSLSSRAFFLESIKETYDMDIPLSIYQKNISSDVCAARNI